MKLFSEYRGLRRELYVLFIGRMMTNMGSMVWPMLTLILSQKLGMNASTIANYMLLYSACALPISLLGGKLADKYNKKNIIVICDIVSIAGFIYASTVELSFTTIVIFAASSLFQSIEYPSYDALIADFTTSADRERAYSLGYLGGNLGFVLAPTLGGLLFNEHLSLAFFINGMSIAFSTALIFFGIRDVSREIDNSQAGVYEQDIDENISPFKYIFGNRVILLVIAAWGISNSVYMMWDYLMPLDMGVIHGTNGSVLYGSMTSLNCLIVVTTTALITRLFRKVLDVNKMITGESLILGGYLVFMLFAKSIAMCYVSIAVFTFGEIFNTLASSPFLTRRIPASHRGRIISVQNVFCTIVSAGMMKIVGVIYDVKGSFVSWSFVLILGAVEIVLTMIMKGFDKIDYKDLYAAKAEEQAE